MELNFEELTRKYPFPEKRPRHHTAPHLYVPYSKLKVVPANYPVPVEKVDWAELFANGKKPDMLDIGTGRGKFLLEMALLYPNKNILGIEIKQNCVQWLKQVIEGEKVRNAGVIWHNVLNGLQFIENESLESVFYLFPDPWPKARHSKRRALNEEVLNEIAEKLKFGGRFYLATDFKSLHEEHILLIENSKRYKIKFIESDLDWNLPKTNKEISCINRSIEYYRMICEKL
jgi:tRNA (guanine-N7-)-methyltransferase